MAINIDRLRKTTIKLATSIVNDITDAIKEKTGEDVTIYEAGDAIRNIPTGDGYDVTKAPIELHDIVFEGSEYINTWIKPFSAENIHRDFKMVYDFEPDAGRTSNNSVGFTNDIGGYLIQILAEFKNNNWSWVIYVPGYQKIPGITYRMESMGILTVTKTDNNINFLTDDGKELNLTITDMSGSDAPIHIGRYHGTGGTYYAKGTLNYFSFEFLT